MVNKRSYYLGGGGVNEPTPGEKKYKSETAIVNQPRFVEPFYRNYDLYDTEGVDGPAKQGPGAGWHHMQNFTSIKDFIEFHRQHMRGKYVAKDDWIEDTQANHRERVEKMKIRASLLQVMIKHASKPCNDLDIEYTDRRDAYICANCFHMSENCPTTPVPTAKELHADKNHNPQHIDWRNGSDRKNDPNYQQWKKDVSHADENDGPNFDYGKGLYSNMDKYKSVKDFEEHADKGPGAFFADDNDDYMLPPKEHGTKIYDWKNSPYQGIPKTPKCDDNDLDFPIDDDVSPILGDTGSMYLDAIPISYQENYTAEPDQDGKSEADLDFGYDLTNEDAPIGRSFSSGCPNCGFLNDKETGDIYDVTFPCPQCHEGGPILDKDFYLDELEAKYLSDEMNADVFLTPSETEIYGLPDGVSSEDKDADQTIETQNPFFGIGDFGRQMYEDKWNI